MGVAVKGRVGGALGGVTVERLIKEAKGRCVCLAGELRGGRKPWLFYRRELHVL